MPDSITIKCQLEELKSVREFVKKNLERLGIRTSLSYQLTLVIDEMSANFIVHSNNNDASKFLKLTIESFKSKLIFTFINNGEFFDFNQYEMPEVSTIVKEKKKGKLGLILVKKIIDKIELSKGENYNICRLIKII